jgi:hypothetical protein
MPILKASDAGSVGLPSGVKEAGQRVDFKPDKFVLQIETKGYRLAWNRAARCPCASVNTQTDQADPNCSLCTGSGWLLFKPAGAVTDEKITGDIDATQQVIVGSTGAVIRGIVSGITNKYVPYDQVIARLEGTSMLTVRAENKLGYYDRICNLDATIAYCQLKDAGSGSTLSMRYPIRDINLLRSASAVFVVDTDFTIVAGNIVWESGRAPASGTQLVCHYLTHPYWRVVDHPHAARLTPVKFKSAVDVPQPLPVSAVLKYEWMLDA